MQSLDDIVVIDLSQNLAGPYCTQILGSLGAQVIKIEPPGGDPARAWGPPFVDGVSALFAAANRGKRSITLDLKSTEDRAQLDRHIEGADIVVQSFRAGVAERLGIDAATLRARDPRLICCTVSAYGEHGPLRDLPGYDPLMQAHAGLVSVTGQPDAPARIGTSIVDMGTGLWAAIGILAALRERDRTNIGAHVGTALFDTALAWNAYHILGYTASGVVPGPVGTAFPLIVPYDAFPTRDGQLMIAAANDNLFRKLCDALHLDDLARDPRTQSNPARVEARAFVQETLCRETVRYSTSQLTDMLRTAGVPCAPVLNIAEVLADPQTRASGMIGESERDGVGVPLTFDGVRPQAGDLDGSALRRP